MQTGLKQAIEGIDLLQGVFITMMPDCLLYDSWMRQEQAWTPEDIASYFGDLIRANREALKSLRAWSSEMQITVESADLLLVLTELKEDFVVGFVFDRKAPLGMVRLYTKRMLSSIEALLPQFQVEERERSVRIVEFVQRYAPEPHTVLLRVSLQTRIPLENLQQPQGLSAEEVENLELAVCDILGLEQLNL